MEACLPGGNDFHPRDITDPEPKRIQKHLSVCVNYIKFKDYINKAYKLQEDEQQLLELPEKIEEMEVKSQELEQEISILKLKKQEQKEIEDNLTKEIAQKKSDCTELESYIIKMEKRHKKSQSDKQEKMQELTEITEENNILQGRLDDLTSQVVTCPEQLHQQLKQITEYYEEAYRDKEETAQNVKLWESLDKNARDIPNYIETITNEVREFEEKVELSNELDKKFEDMLNTNAKMKQNLKENSSKNLNLDKQINLITEEKASLSYDMCRKGSSTNNELIKYSYCLCIHSTWCCIYTNNVFW
jgi:chromosome segregation ATPase